MKVAVIGGGSTYTPELVQGIAARGNSLGIDELVLQDINPERLEVVGGFAERILANVGRPGLLKLTEDLDAALTGASFCLVQLRVGGLRARLKDETIPHRFGILGQETTGPGGFAKALRTVPVVLDIADRYAALGDPDGWLIDFTNPVAIVSQALADNGYRAVGLCNLPIGLQREVAAAFGVDASRVELESVGLNHASWFREVRIDGESVMAELMSRHIDRVTEETGWSAAEIEEAGAIPSYYQAYYHHPKEIFAEQIAKGTRAEEVIGVERGLLELYKDPDLVEKPALLNERGGAWYSEAAIEVIEALGSSTGRNLVVNVPNGDAFGDLPPDLVVEVTCLVDTTGARPRPGVPLTPEQRRLVLALHNYQRLTIRAALSGDRRVAVDALAANPLVPSLDVAEALLDALLNAHREHLPAFFASSGS
ncbi:MAG: 6-phospho-beta-glucosidase [bacterium]|nr:6-phospho-beta-glucosidase [bacterium]MCY3652747.1 6-phospho-beta-glucosidase [bacterium]